MAYSKFREVVDSDGVHIRIGVDSATGELAAWRAQDGTNWGDAIPVTDSDSNPLTIGSGSKNITAYVEAVAGSNRVVVSNGAGFRIKSDNSANADSWSTY